MTTLAPASWATWAIAAIATAGVVARPFAWPEFAWAISGATLLVLLGLLPLHDALAGVAEGTDVYLFLLGMMLLAGLARQEGLFDWLAARAASAAHGSARRLFALVYGVGIVVTVFLSNDATAIVLTPAVAAVARTAKVRDPLPFLFACALVANAASFVLPISNPANLVLYGSHMPPLSRWLPRYALPSLLSVLATFAALRWTARHRLRELIATGVPVPALSAPGKLAAAGIAATACALLAASASGLQLGLPTFLCGAATTLLVLARARRSPGAVLREVSWGVLPLVAGLFVLVEALNRTGSTAALAWQLQSLAGQAPGAAASLSGITLALACNVLNNLPAGLVAGQVVEAAQVPDRVRAAMLIGVDLGPNLSVTGSLATILWLSALRREGHGVGAAAFLRLGALAMPPALLLALAALSVAG